MNHLSIEITVSSILELTYLHSPQLNMLRPICYSIISLQRWCKHLIQVGVQCKCPGSVYCKELICHLQFKVAELQQFILVPSILQFLLQTAVFCFQFLYLKEICKFMICVTVTRNVEYLVSNSSDSIDSSRSKLWRGFTTCHVTSTSL